MLAGRSCKVGNRSFQNQNNPNFTFFEAIIASEPFISNEDVFVVVLFEGTLITADIYYVYDVSN
jgi:hypothetical protein